MVPQELGGEPVWVLLFLMPQNLSASGPLRGHTRFLRNM